MSDDPSRISGSYNLQSVQNAMRLLKLLRARTCIGVTDAGEELGLGKSTVHRLFTTLESEGFVQRDRVKRGYRIGPALFDLGLAAVGDLDVRRKARQPMESLRDQCGETVNLHVLEGNHTRVIDGVESTNTVRVSSRIGVALPANATAAGKVLLAAMRPEAVDALFPNGPISVTVATICQSGALHDELAEVRRRGYATNFGESADGLHGLGVLVLDRFRKPIAALGVAAPAGRLNGARVPELAMSMRAASDEITRVLL
jgi:IclR family acetate operon transcriptional repressor